MRWWSAIVARRCSPASNDESAAWYRRSASASEKPPRFSSAKRVSALGIWVEVQ
jgi:hypothetical protein